MPAKQAGWWEPVRVCASLVIQQVNSARLSPQLSYDATVKLAGQSLRGVFGCVEESPGSTERDAG